MLQQFCPTRCSNSRTPFSFLWLFGHRFLSWSTMQPHTANADAKNRLHHDATYSLFGNMVARLSEATKPPRNIREKPIIVFKASPCRLGGRLRSFSLHSKNYASLVAPIGSRSRTCRWVRVRRLRLGIRVFLPFRRVR